MDWHLVVIILCIYGFFKEFRPLEPFLTPYLRLDKNFTDVQLYSQIYPVWTYSSLATLVPTFLLTDLLRYNVVLILGALFYGATWILLIFGDTVGQMQLMQFFYGFATATEIAYYGYSYAAIDPVHYKKSTSYVRCVLECGRFCSFGLSQILISTKSVQYLHLNYIASAGSILIFIVALLLPCISWRKSVDRMRRVHEQTLEDPAEDEPMKKFASDERIDEKERNETVTAAVSSKSLHDRSIWSNEVRTYNEFMRFYFANLWITFKSTYSTACMWRWSLWSALAMCGMFQVTNYIQTLWDVHQASQGDVWNGVVEAVCTLLAAVVVMCMQFVTVRWEVWGECTIAAISVLDFALLMVMSRTSSLILIYSLYVIFRILYETMFTIALYNIAKLLTTQGFGLVFGFNTFVALILQTILTFTVADEHGLALEIRDQFLVYAAYHGVVSIIFMVMGFRTVTAEFCTVPPVDAGNSNA